MKNCLQDRTIMEGNHRNKPIKLANYKALFEALLVSSNVELQYSIIGLSMKGTNQ